MKRRVAALLFLLALRAPAAPELLSARTSEWDLEVSGLLGGGRTNGFLTRAQLEALPSTTATNAMDSALKRPARYDGVELTVLREALGVPATSDVVFAVCADGYAAHFPAEYLAAFEPMLVLRIDGLGPEGWGRSLASGVDMAPFYVNTARFRPRLSERAAGRDESERNPYAVTRLVFATSADTIARLLPADDAPAATKDGAKLALRECLSCHEHAGFGGTTSGRPWLLLRTWAGNTNYFRRYVVSPKSVQPASRMPAFKGYPEEGLDALQAYFLALRPR
jgi:mono/diheme cytochrome c family protein